MIEGPYGNRKPLQCYENVVFIVGGTGVSGALSYLLEHVNNIKHPGTRTRDITLVWTTKQAPFIRDVAGRELRSVLGRDDVHTHFHATTGQELPDSVNANNIEKAPDVDVSYAISFSRPNIGQIVLNVIDEVHSAGKAGGRTAIVAFGPAALANEARSAVHQALKQGERDVEYFEETFW